MYQIYLNERFVVVSNLTGSKGEQNQQQFWYHVQHVLPTDTVKA